MIALTEDVKFEFEVYASKESPREACGLVAILKGKQRFYECKNLSASPRDFILDPRDFSRVSDIVSSYGGDIVSVVHSHPATPATPSMSDLVGCEVSGIQWAIFSIKYKSWHYFTPTGYQAPLIGRAFKHGVFDCYSAVVDWYKMNTGITLPYFHRDPYWWENGQNLLMENFHKANFVEVKDGSIQIGDVILMNISSPVVNHAAVYIGNDKIFHQTVNRLSSREIYGGMWKKNTRVILRQK